MFGFYISLLFNYASYIPVRSERKQTKENEVPFFAYLIHAYNTNVEQFKSFALFTFVL